MWCYDSSTQILSNCACESWAVSFSEPTYELTIGPPVGDKSKWKFQAPSSIAHGQGFFMSVADTKRCISNEHRPEGKRNSCICWFFGTQEEPTKPRLTQVWNYLIPPFTPRFSF
eukprot:TRINITY_DN980_c0_g1_i4.p1 TRINITY_DN980_c0_g1~~TRINITY_DN980_c0_g1_i4.p1  ORF type:complete len:114 (-),score=6.75 TRINITY_DN980_c0_g1_i4:74-415(-)